MDRSPTHLVKEIILVDDASDMRKYIFSDGSGNQKPGFRVMDRGMYPGFGSAVKKWV